ncbi:reverse transcriptase domain-containing protein, partial [Tanacetum coccineum]
LTELQSNAYHKKFDEYVVDHVANVLEMLDLIKILNVDTDQLRVKCYVANCNNADGPGYYELMAWLDSRQDDMRIDQMTKSALCHSWIYGWANTESSDDIVSSDDEWEEYEYGNPLDTATDSFFKP